MEGLIMRDSFTWMIRLGFILLVTGLILMIISLLFHINPNTFIEEEDFRRNLDFHLLFYRVYGFVGIVLFIAGITLYITGMRDMYFKPLKQLLYPQIPPDQQRNSTTHDSHEILCGNCKRRIPYESEKCPYCGVKQLHQVNITMKNL